MRKYVGELLLFAVLIGAIVAAGFVRAGTAYGAFCHVQSPPRAAGATTARLCGALLP